MTTRWIFAAALLLMATEAMASSPQLTVITPRGVTRGTEAELTFHGARLADAEEILFYEPGLKVLELKPEAAKVVARVQILPECALGEHTAQVRTRSGISEYRTFFVGPFAAVPEKEPNSEFSSPQAVSLNVTVEGVIQNEDVDYFVIEARKDQRISVEIEGVRFGQTLFDPYIGILDERRFEVVVADDTPLLRQDAAVSMKAPADGKYIIEVRDSAYGGDGNCRYRLHVGTFPRPLAVYPAGGKVGSEVELTFIGDAGGPITRKVSLPAEELPEYVVFAEDAGGVAPSGNPFRLFEHDNAFEAEPNNSTKEATPAALPLAFNGVIQQPGDVDYFRFTAKKGQVLEVECYARRVRSPLDPVMNLYHGDGKSLAGNDDSRGPDSYIRMTVPAVPDARHPPRRTVFAVTAADLRSAGQPVCHADLCGTCQLRWRSCAGRKRPPARHHDGG